MQNDVFVSEIPDDTSVRSVLSLLRVRTSFSESTESSKVVLVFDAQGRACKTTSSCPRFPTTPPSGASYAFESADVFQREHGVLKNCLDVRRTEKGLQNDVFVSEIPDDTSVRSVLRL